MTAGITAEQIYQLNRMNSTANKVQLGTLIQNAESPSGNMNLANGTILVGNVSGVGTAVTPTGDVTLTNAGVTAIGANKVTEAMLVAMDSTALNVHRVCVGLFDPSAVAGSRTIAAHDLSVNIPAKAIITRVYYQVVTSFTSATNAATIALSIENANDVKTAVAISNGANPWNAGLFITAVIETAATLIQASVARKIVATVAVEALTAGKMLVFAEYVQGL